MLASVAGEVAVVLIDHRQAGAHEAGQIEDRDACAQRKSRVGMPEIVGTANRLDPGGDLCDANRARGSCAGRCSRRELQERAAARLDPGSRSSAWSATA